MSDQKTSVQITAEVDGIEKIDALGKSVQGLTKITDEAAKEEDRLAAIVEASKRRQQMAAQELLQAEKKAYSEAQTSANKVAAAQREAAQATEALSSAFKSLGVRPLQAVVEETHKLQAALAQVRASGITSPEQQQAIAAFQAKLAELRAEAQGVQPAAASAAVSVAGLSREAESLGGVVGGAARQVAAMAGAFVGLQGIAGVAKDVINTGAAFETLEGRLSSLLGSSEKAKDVFGQIKDLAKTTPFEVQGLTESYVKLTAFGLQPTMKQMQAISDTAATLGGGTEALSRVTLALGQAWTKSKLQGDEILQLAEAGVPVWDLLAKATGKNTAELQKMSEAGTLGRSVILKLIDALGEENMGASAKLMATFSGAVSNAHDALDEFYSMIAQSGVLDYLTKQIQSLLVEFEEMKTSGELQVQAKAIADGFVEMAEGVKAAIEAVSAMSGVIKLGIEAYIAWRVAAMTLIPGLSGVAAAAGAAATSAKAMGAAAATAAVETRALGAASGPAAAGVGLLGNSFRLLKGLSLVGLATEVGSLGMEFFRAKAAAEEADRVLKKMLEPSRLNGPAKDLELVETKAALARVKTEELAAAFYLAAERGKATGEALKAALGEANINAPEGIGDMLRGLDQIQGSARATGDEIRASLVERLQSLNAGELADFAKMADFAFGRGKISAEQLAFAIDTQLDAALLKVGVSASTASDGMTAKFRESANNVSLVTRQLDALQSRGVETDRVFIDLITKTIAGAGSRQEFQFLADQVERFGTKAGLAKGDVDSLLTLIKQKTDAASPGIDSLAEAFSRLGMKSRESLKQTEQSAKEAFDYIRNNGGTINEQRAAWDKYAEAAKAAHNGILPPMLRAQEELYKIGEAGKNAGRNVRSGMDDAANAISKVRSDAEKLADRLANLKNTNLGAGGFGNQSTGNGSFEDLRRAGMTPEQMKNAGYSSREIEDYIVGNDKVAPGFVNRQVTSAGVNTYQMGIDAGLNDAAAKKLGEIYGYYAAKANTEAQRQAGGGMSLAFGADDYAAVTRDYANQAIAEAKRLVSAEAAGGKGSGSGSSGPQFWGAPNRAVTVHLNIGGRTTSITAASQGDADALIRALQTAASAQS